MRAHIISPEVVYIDLTVAEHLALAASVRSAVGRLMDEEIEPRLGLEPDAARDVALGIRVFEGLARLAGVGWLGPPRPLDGGITGEVPVLSILFAPDGSAWRLSVEQLWFVEACATWSSTSGHASRSS